jgi:hypothetical protein
MQAWMAEGRTAGSSSDRREQTPAAWFKQRERELRGETSEGKYKTRTERESNEEREEGRRW